MYRTVSASLAALLLFSGCGAKPTEKAEPTKPEVAANKPAEPAKPVTPKPADEPAPKKKPAKKKAAPKDDKKLTSSERQQYVKALNEGRTAHRAKDFAAAISAFDKALALFPDDPRALSEKGWSEFQAKDLKAAASDTNNAIGRTTNSDLLGSSYYNLGRIREEQQKTKEAVEAYQESLKVRPGNKIVKDRLASLNAALVEKGSLSGPLLALAGPFASDAELCKAAMLSEDPEAKERCDLGAAEPSDEIRVLPGSGAILSVKLFATQRSFSTDSAEDEFLYYPESYYHLAIQTAAGWFLWSDYEYVYSPGVFGISAELAVEQFALKDLVPGGEPELLLVSTNSRHDSDMGLNEVEMSSSTSLVVCGLGASQKPSCALVTVKESSERGILLEDLEAEFKADNPDFTHDGFYKKAWALAWSFTAEGKLQLMGTASKDMSAESKALIGTHTLSFE